MSFCSRKKKRDDEGQLIPHKVQEEEESIFPSSGPSQCAFNDIDSFILEKIFSGVMHQ